MVRIWAEDFGDRLLRGDSPRHCAARRRQNRSGRGRGDIGRLATRTTIIAGKLRAVGQAGSPNTPISSSRQFVEQRLRLLEIGRVEAFGEPAIDGHEKVAGFGVVALVAAEPGEACGGA